MKIKKMFLFSIFIMFLLSCKKEVENSEPNSYKYVNEEIYEPTETDFYNFKHYLDSEYSFDTKITDIKVIEHKGVFEVQKEKFGTPEKVNGKSIVIEFDIKNPYDRAMRIPFPEYFQIASDEFEGLEGYGYSRRDHTYTGFASIIESDQGLALNKIGKYNDDSLSRRLLVDFKPNETKSFIIKFTNPFPLTIEKVLFIGFNKEIENLKDSGLINLTEYGLYIDLKNKKIIDLISIKR